MDRIRKNDNGTYEVLVTPHHRFNSSVEFILGGWSDARLKGFEVREYPDMNSASIVAFKQPSLDWEYLVSLQKGSYEILYKEVRKTLDKTDMVYDFDAKMLNSKEAKGVMFDRVKKYSERFRLCYNYNDLITFKIVNPWTSNLKELSKVLEQNPNLKLVRKYTKNGVIHMVGKTDVNTTYEIILCPTIIDHWSRWIKSNGHLPEEVVEKSLSDIQDQQKLLDETVVLR